MPTGKSSIRLAGSARQGLQCLVGSGDGSSCNPTACIAISPNAIAGVHFDNANVTFQIIMIVGVEAQRMRSWH